MNAVAYLVLLLPPLASAGQVSSLSQREPDELMLQQVGITVDAETLLALVRHRTAPPSPAEIRTAIDRIRAGDDAARRAALAALLGAGPSALPYLQRAAREYEDPSGEPLRTLVRVIERESVAHTTALVRLLGRKVPDRAAVALLDILPTAEEGSVVAEIGLALQDLARRETATVSILRKALEDPLALRRSVAIDALALALPGEAMTSLKPHLNDPVPGVRLRAALALARTQEEAVDRMISLLVELPQDLTQEVEEYLHGLAQDAASRPPVTDKPESREAARDAWQKWWQATTGESLLQELRKRTLVEDDRAQMEKLIRRLGAEEFEDREKASAELKAIGPRVRTLLAQSLKSDDPEVVQRVRVLLDGMAKENAIPLPSSVPRLLALRRPAGAVEALLAYLPFNEDAGLGEDIVQALVQIVRLHPASRPALVDALNDAHLLRRMAALDTLGRLPAGMERDRIRRCLEDAEVSVRIRAALALLRQGDRTAIPALLGMLGSVTGLEDERLVDDVLTRLCDGLTRPTTSEGSTPEARKKRQEEWLMWWQENSARVALPRFEDSPQEVVRNSGITLAILNGNGTIVAYDTDFRLRWQLRGLATPFDAQLLSGERVLVTEHDLRRVTERNLQGEVLWEKKLLSNPIQAERLPSGNTFIVCRDRLVEVTRNGREVLSIARPMGDIYTARKQRDGSVLCLSSQGRCFRLDARGTELSGFRVPTGLGHFGNELLPGGGALIPISWQNKITEYDREGKVVKEHPFATPVSVQRLSHGGLLLLNQQWPPRLVELDRNGQILRETNLTANAIRAVRR